MNVTNNYPAQIASSFSYYDDSFWYVISEYPYSNNTLTGIVNGTKAQLNGGYYPIYCFCVDPQGVIWAPTPVPSPYSYNSTLSYYDF